MNPDDDGVYSPIHDSHDCHINLLFKINGGECLMTENGKTVCVLYLCKRDNHCKGRCYEQCHLTSEKAHAKNTFDKEPWNDPIRFKRDETPHKIYYTEKENEE